MKKNKKNVGGKKYKVLGGIVLLAVVIAAVLIVCLGKNDYSLQELQEKKGEIRTVGQEEYEFFRKLVLRDAVEELTEEELDALVKEKINRNNAQFLLASQMGLCDMYSFEGFQKDMEDENAQRKLKKQKGEVFYGPVEFNLTTYYNYISTNQKLDMVTFVTENADEQVTEGARAYFEEFSEKYLTIEEIKYSLVENGEQQEAVVKREDFSTLEKTDSTLFEFLYYGKPDDTMDYLYNNHERTVQIISVEYEELSFENNAERVVRDYITNVYLENWIQDIEENYPVEFKLS